MEEKKYWVGFNHVKGIGAVRFQRLQDYFPKLEDAWNASSGELHQAGIGEKATASLIRFRNAHDIHELYENILQKDIKIITTEEKAYPTRLLQIAAPPPVLYVRGNITEEDQQAIAVVGTRKVTSYGKNVVRDLAGVLAANKVTIVSGLARGVDSEAHRAILKSGGRTIAVLGSGLDVIYPPENTQLAQEIVENGAVISDYAPGTPPEGVNFPPRNRIIAGLSMATVVIEAGQRSGALITASFTADQGKDVFAVPGSIFAPQSKGTNKLIFDGAYPLIHYESIFEILDIHNVQYQHTLQRDLPTDEVELLILKLLQPESLHIDDLQAASGLPVARISSALTMLELKGFIKNTGNMTYTTNYELKEEYAKYA